MGRLHSNGKGISASAIPYSRTPPAWLKTTPEQVVDQICKLAKKGATPSQIGVVLRDSHGIAQVKVVTGMSIAVLRLSLVWLLEIVDANVLDTGNKILRILKSNGTIYPIWIFLTWRHALAVYQCAKLKMPLLGLWLTEWNE
jgi:hypothetical protein